MPTDAGVALNPNPIVAYLGKPRDQFTRADLIDFVENNGITSLDFRYTGGDGRLKQLTFPITSREYLERVLTLGERVDGSSLFSFVESTSSDLYVVPRYNSAFLNPFASEPTLSLLCSFYGQDGKPLESAPEQVMAKAQRALQEATGLTLETMGELEYYILSEPDPLYPVVEQQGYHESQPFSKWVELRREVLHHLATMGCHIKYAHSEVGNMVRDGVQMVQGEIEMLPVPINQCADELALAKWVFREVANSYGLVVTWAPKIIVGQAGSGMHFHSSITKDGRNVTADENGLTDETKKVIAGFLRLAESLTAFGNTVPTSFLRLVPHQEAPTAVCWGESNRSALIRVPLGWKGIGASMTRDANPQDTAPAPDYDNPQTFEIRSPDGSANIPMLLAGLAVAARLGLTGEDSLAQAEKLHITGDASAVAGLTQLPASCSEAADKLDEQRAFYEAEGIFPPALIDALIEELRTYNDRDLATDLKNEPERLPALVQRYLHVG